MEQEVNHWDDPIIKKKAEQAQEAAWGILLAMRAKDYNSFCFWLGALAGISSTVYARNHQQGVSDE